MEDRAHSASLSNETDPRSFDVLIVGAGIAGLACARILAERGLHVCVVEASDRVGGRIATAHSGTEIIELGAEFVHGQPQDLLALIHEAGLTLCERDGSQVSFTDGAVREQVEEERDETFSPLEELRSLAGPDLSFRDYLRRTSLSDEDKNAVLGYVEGFNASDANLISARSLGLQQTAENEIEGDRLAHIREGYDRLPAFLADRLQAAGGDLRLNLSAEAIHWGVGRVALETAHGELVAPRAVITVPLGVLQARTLRIVPEPYKALAAVALMHMGSVCRFTLVFRERFWETLVPQPAMRSLSFLFDLGELPSVWWSTHPEGGRSLTGWVGGPRSDALSPLSEDQLADLGCRALGRLFRLSPTEVRAQLEICRSHNWAADPLARGAYSYVGVEGVEASAQLSEPVEHTLFFAGEHTDTSGHWGTVHGALRSGVRVAQQILDAP